MTFDVDYEIPLLQDSISAGLALNAHPLLPFSPQFCTFSPSFAVAQERRETGKGFTRRWSLLPPTISLSRSHTLIIWSGLLLELRIECDLIRREALVRRISRLPRPEPINPSHEQYTKTKSLESTRRPPNDIHLCHRFEHSRLVVIFQRERQQQQQQLSFMLSAEPHLISSQLSSARTEPRSSRKVYLQMGGWSEPSKSSSAQTR